MAAAGDGFHRDELAELLDAIKELIDVLEGLGPALRRVLPGLRRLVASARERDLRERDPIQDLVFSGERGEVRVDRRWVPVTPSLAVVLKALASGPAGPDGVVGFKTLADLKRFVRETTGQALSEGALENRLSRLVKLLVRYTGLDPQRLVSRRRVVRPARAGADGSEPAEVTVYRLNYRPTSAPKQHD